MAVVIGVSGTLSSSGIFLVVPPFFGDLVDEGDSSSDIMFDVLEKFTFVAVKVPGIYAAWSFTLKTVSSVVKRAKSFRDNMSS